MTDYRSHLSPHSPYQCTHQWLLELAKFNNPYQYIDKESYSSCKARKVGCSCFPLAPQTTLSPKHRGRVQLPRTALANYSKSTYYIFVSYNGFLKKKHIVEMFWKIIELEMWILLETFEQFFLMILLIFDIDTLSRKRTFFMPLSSFEKLNMFKSFVGIFF